MVFSLSHSLKELLLGAIDERERVSDSKGQRPLHPDYLTLTLLTLFLYSNRTLDLTLDLYEALCESVVLVI